MGKSSKIVHVVHVQPCLEFINIMINIFFDLLTFTLRCFGARYLFAVPARPSEFYCIGILFEKLDDDTLLR